MTKITISVCTYNGESRLPKVFECLANQTDVTPEDWEILIVDNASKDSTPKVVQEHQSAFQGICNVRYVVEQKQGLAFARTRALKEAVADLVAFVDDDNLLFPNWVNRAISFAETHPQVGAFGGQIHGKFGASPPSYLNKVKHLLAVVEKGRKPFQYLPERRMLPPGAGLVVKKEVWLKHVPDRLSLSGRIGASLIGGEDLEAIVHIQKIGWEIWYNPEMEMDHDIPSARLEEEYLLKIAWGTGLCRHHIRVARYTLWQNILLTPLHILYDLYKVTSYALPFPTKKNEEQISKKIELTYRLGTFVSPFCMLKARLANK